MTTSHCTLTFSETMSGYFSLNNSNPHDGAKAGEDKNSTLAMHADVTIIDMDRFITDPNHLGSLGGTIEFPELGENLVAHTGVFNLFKPTGSVEETHMIYEMGFDFEGQAYYLAGKKIVKDDPGFDLWSDTTTLFTNLHKGDSVEGEVVGSGILSLGVKQLMDLVSTVEVPDAKDTTEKISTISAFGQFFMGELWDSYGLSKLVQKEKTSSADDGEIDYDVIVIGSGFGGSVTACRLAQKGHSVCVLERGRRWKPEEYPREPSDPWWWNSECPEKQNGWIDMQFYDDMGVAQGCGVGGGSLIYANVVIDAKPFVFDEGWPEEINYETLKPYYEKAGKMLNVQKIPDNQLTERAKLMKEGAESIGQGERYEKLDLAVSFNKDYNYNLDDPFNESHSKTYTNAQGVEQGTCIHCGNCDIGCQVKAKNTLDLNYLALAEQHNAEIKPLHLVKKITPIDKGYRIDFYQLDPDSESKQAGSLNAKKVIVAAGTMGTNELLLRCRDEFDTLTDLSPALGKNWSSNGDFLTPALYPGREISPTRGPTITSAINFLDGSEDGARFYVEDGGFPDILGNAMQEFNADSKFGLFNSALSMAIRDRNPISCVMPWFGQAIDASDGEMELSRSWLPPFKKKFNLNWNVSKSEHAVQGMVDMHKKLSDATGGTHLVPPTWKYLKDLITPHPLGGCKMGDSRKNGVVNHKGEVFGYPGLYVADGSIFPKAIGLNPSKTIAALAERIAEFID